MTGLNWEAAKRREMVGSPPRDRRPLLMKAKYNGKCWDCGDRIQAGSAIEYQPQARAARCIPCYKKDKNR